MGKRPGSRILLALIGTALFSLSAYSASPVKTQDGNAEAIEHFGVNQGNSINKGFLFINAEYVEPPYIVERRGLDIYINDRLVRPGPEWPPFDSRVDEDPGEPPADLPPFKTPPGMDPRNGYWQRKSRYLRQHFDKAEATRRMMETYRKSPLVQDVKRREQTPSEDVIEYVITFKDGRRPLNLVVDMPRLRPGPGDGKQDPLSKAEERKDKWERKLAWGSCCFLGDGVGEMRPTRQLAVQILDILVSEDTLEAKQAKLKQQEAWAPRSAMPFFRNLAAQFKPTPRMRERFNHLKYHAEIVDQAGWGPQPMPDFGDWSQWVEFRPESEVTLSETTEGGAFIDLDTAAQHRPPAGLNLEQEAAISGWAKRVGVDARVLIKGNQRGLRFFNVVTAVAGGSNRWRKTTAFQLQRDIIRIERWTASGDERRMRNLRNQTIKFPEQRLPGMITFKTSQGGIGMLQIVGFSSEPEGIKVRCKMAQSNLGSELAQPIGLLSATQTKDASEFEWRITRKRPSQVVHGWYWFDAGGIREHACGGRKIAEAKAMDLILKISKQENELLLQRGCRRSDELGELTANVTNRIHCPQGTVLKTSYQAKPTWLTDQLQPLWKAELIQDGRIIRTVIYGVRVTPEAQVDELFDPRNPSEALRIGKEWTGSR